MPGRALDLHRPADAADPFADRAQAHSMFCIDVESASIVRYGKLYRVDIVHQCHIHPLGATVSGHIRKRFLRDPVERLFRIQR